MTEQTTIAVDALDAGMRRSLQRMSEDAEALYEMSQTVGYQTFLRWLEEMEADIGRVGLRDSERSRDYYVGAQDMIAKLKTLVPRVVELGREAAAVKAVESNPDFLARYVASGSGSLSVG